MDLMTVNSYKGFKANTCEPIVGVSQVNAFERPLIEAICEDEVIAIGTPVKLTVAPNKITFKAATSGETADGIVVMGETDVLDNGDKFPAPRKGQSTLVATFGSGAEVYLPVVNSFAESTVSVYNSTDKQVDSGGDITIGSIRALSGVMNGLKSTVGSENKIETAACSVVKFKI